MTPKSQIRNLAEGGHLSSQPCLFFFSSRPAPNGPRWPRGHCKTREASYRAWPVGKAGPASQRRRAAQGASYTFMSTYKYMKYQSLRFRTYFYLLLKTLWPWVYG